MGRIGYGRIEAIWEGLGLRGMSMTMANELGQCATSRDNLRHFDTQLCNLRSGHQQSHKRLCRAVFIDGNRCCAGTEHVSQAEDGTGGQSWLSVTWLRRPGHTGSVRLAAAVLILKLFAVDGSWEQCQRRLPDGDIHRTFTSLGIQV